MQRPVPPNRRTPAWLSRRSCGRRRPQLEGPMARLAAPSNSAEGGETRRERAAAPAVSYRAAGRRRSPAQEAPVVDGPRAAVPIGEAGESACPSDGTGRSQPGDPLFGLSRQAQLAGPGPQSPPSPRPPPPAPSRPTGGPRAPGEDLIEPASPPETPTLDAETGPYTPPPSRCCSSGTDARGGRYGCQIVHPDAIDRQQLSLSWCAARGGGWRRSRRCRA